MTEHDQSAGSPLPEPALHRGDAIRIDPDICSFLDDHTVGGTALLPTALQVGLIAAAARDRFGGHGALSLTGVRVEEPVRFADAAVCTLTALAEQRPDGAAQLSLQSENGACHLHVTRAQVGGPMSAEPGQQAKGPAQSDTDLPGRPDLVYPPMFHGPAFQVLGQFGRHADGLVVRPAAHLPPWEVPGHGDGSAAQLLELMLQACGVWELAQTGRMMRPSRIDHIHLAAPTAEPGNGLWAHIWPVDWSGTRAFDGAVRDSAGRVPVRMAGYRPVELGEPPLAEVAHRLTAHIGALPEPAP